MSYKKQGKSDEPASLFLLLGACRRRFSFHFIFYFFGIENWKILTLIYSAIPIFNALIFLKTPIASLLSDGEEGMSLGELFKNKIFWILVIIMLCAGASELSVSQWSSLFAEKGLGLSKTMGDIAGPMFLQL